MKRPFYGLFESSVIAVTQVAQQVVMPYIEKRKIE